MIQSPEPSLGASATPRPAWPGWLLAQLLVAGALAGVWWKMESEPPPVLVAPPEPLDVDDLERARAHLCTQGESLNGELTAALFPNAERSVAEFMAFQVQSSDLQLKEIQWAPLPAEGDLVPVELTMKLEGSYYNLPILVDGMFHQARPLEITYVAVETPRPMIAHTFTTVRARFWRPAPLATAWLSEQSAAVDGLQVLDPNSAEALLICAAEVELLEGFLGTVPALSERSRRNKTAVTRALPGMLLKLPTSALGWAGLQLEDGELRALSQPEL